MAMTTRTIVSDIGAILARARTLSHLSSKIRQPSCLQKALEAGKLEEVTAMNGEILKTTPRTGVLS